METDDILARMTEKWLLHYPRINSLTTNMDDINEEYQALQNINNKNRPNGAKANAHSAYTIYKVRFKHFY